MKSIPLLILVAVMSCSHVSEAQQPEDQAAEVVQWLIQNRSGKVYRSFNHELKDQISKKQFNQIYTGLIKVYGMPESSGQITGDTSNGRENFTLTPLYFEKNLLTLSLGFDQKNKISSIFFLPQSYGLPDAARNIVFGKKQLTVQTDTFSLQGELIFPITSSPVPVVVLVHGSGPHDMDETIGPNKVFKDLALELAVQGIATFRYTKRSKAYPEAFAKGQEFTLDNETVDDALSAIALVSRQSEVDSNMIFLAGHSLGAYAAPIIASRSQQLTGIVMMASPNDQIYELIEEQLHYLFSLDDEKPFLKKILLKRAKKQTELLRNGEYKNLKKFEIVTAYWPLVFFQDLSGYIPTQVVDSINLPTLIMQGKRDYQVPYESQFMQFNSALGDDTLVEFTVFEGLNHLFIYGEGPPTPTEYFLSGHVHPDVINAISGWVKKVGSQRKP